ncbi:DNA-binding protein [Candidatus Microgenomates bacterium]|nr:MAG: DNA-binding protein [Candidatus Microgenomates bacterium]
MKMKDILKAADIQEYLAISRSKAYSLLNREDFPTIMFDKTKRVRKVDFLNWVENQKRKNV